MEIILVLLLIIGIFAAGLFAMTAMREMAIKKMGSRSPRLTMGAEVAEKQEDGSGSFRIIFQTEGGEQINLSVRKSEYNRLSVGDRGRLTWQGTRYVTFDREEK